MVKLAKIFLFSIMFMAMICGHSLAWDVPDTGQAACYEQVSYGWVVKSPCPAAGEAMYGQDANYAINPQSYTKLDSAGAALSDDAAEWAMVQDNVTGLVWEVKTAANKDTTYTWENALNFAENLTLGGFSDWRLPTVKELSSIINRGRVNPAINTTYFASTASDYYWSATAWADGSGQVWAVKFNDGRVPILDDMSTSNSFYVRAVRGEKLTYGGFIDNGDGTVTDMSTGLMWQQDTEIATWSWTQALDYCETLELGDYTDWRLPNINELQSLLDYGKVNMSIDSGAFPNTSNTSYWSSTTHADSRNWGWHIGFSNSNLRYSTKEAGEAVRAVRGPVSVDDLFKIRHAIMILKTVAGIEGPVLAYDANDDGHTGVEDAINILQRLSN
jgi:hypothetical protein